MNFLYLLDVLNAGNFELSSMSRKGGTARHVVFILIVDPELPNIVTEGSSNTQYESYLTRLTGGKLLTLFFLKF